MEIDFICHECGELVYKARPGEFLASHVCRTPEERERVQRSPTVTFSKKYIPIPIIEVDWMPEDQAFLTDGTSENPKIIKLK